MVYYAVASGREVGIYTSWEECQYQIKGFKNAVYKKFTCKNDAENFITKNTVYTYTESLSEQENELMKNIELKEKELLKKAVHLINILYQSIVSDNSRDYYVYTDGACSNNGSSKAAVNRYIFWRK